jgi:GntR family transcriptional regulator, transcriptional repressor for pyruvate dehydrogenase complex
MGVFTPIRTPRASEEVFTQIKTSILTGKFQSGGKLPSERELTTAFGVSRGVIREALRMLELSGFLTIRQGHGGGAYVTDLTLSHVETSFLDLFQTNTLSMTEVAQVRLFVEPEVARLAALNFNKSHLKRLEDAEAGEDLPFKSENERIARLTKVHKVLAGICGNQFFQAIVQSMMKITADVVLTAVSDLEALHGPGEHKTLVKAVKAGDGDRAAREMALHLKAFANNFIELEKVYRQQMIVDR